ncbi:MAG: MFS transporter [Firmicutes bacterium]|nr:MFS transporter [Bacillota bacterium]
MNKNHALLYLHTFLMRTGKNVTSVFSAVLLYRLGFDVSFILLFIGLMFGLMGLLSPLSPFLVSRIGFVWSHAIGNASLAVGSLLLLLGDFSAVTFVLSFIFLALAGGINHPIGHMVKATFIDDKTRGRTNAKIMIVSSLSIIPASLLVGLLMDYAFALYIFMIVILLATIVPIYFLMRKQEPTRKYKLREPYKNFFDKSFSRYIPQMSLQAFPIIEGAIIALFIYLLVGDIATVAYIVIAAAIVEIIAIYIFGRSKDKYGRKAFLFSTILRSTASLILAFVNFTIWLVTFGRIWLVFTARIHDTSVNVLVQKATTESTDPIIFTTSKEMVLCFTEFLALMMLSVLALFIHETALVVIFVLSFISVWAIYFRWLYTARRK